MIPGIDPKVDIAFKKVFGSDKWRNLTISLINAVLCPPPGQQLVALELLNPYTERMTIDDKLSILDIKARDDQGRLLNVEMQMVPSVTLPQRFLYYWSRLYAQQLEWGEEYHRLFPTISICFVNGRLFPGEPRYHRRFRLQDDDHMILTDNMEFHVLELSNFERLLADLDTPLDLWLYFFKNGDGLDADALPEPLDNTDVRQAMEILKMFSQDEMERELYEGRLKARRDARMRETLIERSMAQLAHVEQQRAEAEQQRAEAEQQRAEAEQQRAEAEQQRAEAEQLRAEAEQQRTAAEQDLLRVARERDQAIHMASSSALVARIQLSERLLGRRISDASDLHLLDEAALQTFAQSLEQELVQQRQK